MIVDLHSHYLPLGALHAEREGPVELTGLDRVGGRVAVRVDGQSMVLPVSLVDPDAQVADARIAGIDRRALQPPPFTILYELAPDRGLAWSRLLNDEIAADAACYPDTLVGFASVPLQCGGAVAAAELARAAGLGLAGVEILTSVQGRGLDAADLTEFWAAAAELAMPVVIHPHYVAGADRMADLHLRNLVGNPTETALAGARLLFSGLLQRFPDLAVVLCHGGGALPGIIGRLRHGFRTRSEFADGATDPDDGLSRLYLDTVVFDTDVLRELVGRVGPDHLVVGSDYPFDMAEPEPVRFVTESGLDPEDVQRVLATGERLLAPGVEPSHGRNHHAPAR